MGITTSEGRVRRPRRIVPWIAGLGIVVSFATAALLWLLEGLSYIGDNGDGPTPTLAPEIVAGAAAVALLACLPRVPPRLRTWGWSLAGAVAYFGVASSDWLTDGSIVDTPILALLAAGSGGALVLAAALQAYSAACARCADAPSAG